MDKVNTKRGEVRIFKSKDEIGQGAAEFFIAKVNEAITANGRASVALSGGSSPPLMYAAILEQFADKVDWSKVHFFVGDERCVPHASPESNWGTAYRELLSKLPIPKENLHPTENQDVDPTASASAYETHIREFFGTAAGSIPRFDLIHLGMGPDGHTASLFPNTKGLAVTDKLVIDNYVERMTSHRLSFTFPFINAAANVMFMTTGAEKSHVLAEALQSDTITYPVQNVSPKNGKSTWFVDDAAAKDLLREKAST